MTVSVFFFSLLGAMALRRLNRREEAASLVADARARIEHRFLVPLTTGSPSSGFWFDWINARILWREAEAALAD